MKLDRESLLWGIEHVFKDGDTDLFPKPVEIRFSACHSPKFVED
ncbi:hypothetical protein [Bacillus smithii]|nr:hypothetical protein [Bacillus smithii]